jgi:hypothetical protein
MNNVSDICEQIPRILSYNKYAYDGDIDVAGVQTGPTPIGDW